MGETKTYGIPDLSCGQVGLTAKWLPGDKLGAYASRHLTYSSEDALSGLLVGKPTIHQLQWCISIFHPVTRKLINESNQAFLAGQNLYVNSNEDDVEVRLELTKLSRQYRSIIEACLEDLQAEASSTTDKENKATCLQLVSVFYNIEFLWHLCEILFVEVTPGDMVLPQLLEWIRFHFFRSDRRAAAMLAGDYGEAALESGIEAEPDYWNTVTDLILQGRINAVLSLLRLHSNAGNTAFKAADKALRTMPEYKIYGGLSMTEFNVQWSAWQNDIKAKLQSGMFASEKELEFIMRLVAGEEEAFRQVEDLCETWYRFMVAHLLYTEPTVKSFDLSFHASQSINRYGGVTRLKHSDQVIIALLGSDLHQVIKLIEQTTENGWFAAHLTNLLFHCGCLKIIDNQEQVNVTARLHEQLLLDYGTLLMGHSSLWQVGVTYLDHCPSEGRARLELLLPNLSLDTEAKALKIIQVAKERDLGDIVCTICKIMGKRAELQDRLGNALTWALRSLDSAYATYIATKFLDMYSKVGGFQSLDLLDNLGSCMLVSDRLTFLGKYCEFHQLYGNGDFQEAASLLVSLLSSRIAPKSFWLNLLMDALPLLEQDEILFSAGNTTELLQCVYEAEEESWGEKGNLIRLALVRNMSRSLIQEDEVQIMSAL